MDTSIYFLTEALKVAGECGMEGNTAIIKIHQMMESVRDYFGFEFAGLNPTYVVGQIARELCELRGDKPWFHEMEKSGFAVTDDNIIYKAE